MHADAAADEARVELALREMILAVEAYREAAAARLGLTVSDAQALSYLLARGSLGQTELGTLLGLTTGTITVLVDRLERHGLVHRTAHPTDRRRTVVELTSRASDEVRPAQELFHNAVRTLTATNGSAAIEVLDSITQTLRQQ